MINIYITQEHVQNLHNVRDSRDKAARSEAVRKAASGATDEPGTSTSASQRDRGERGSPTNSMSASEPNLPTSLVDPWSTPGLLDSFAAAARRNMSSGPHGSNAVRSSHAHSLVRLALANSPSEFTCVSACMIDRI